MNDHQAISIVISFFNEKESLEALLREVLAVLDTYPRQSEAILVDDGSRDGGADVVKKFAEKDSRIKLIVLRRNYGQTAAWAAGIDCSSNEILVFMDGDLQNDPKEIPALVSKLTREGYDVASGWRKNRKDPLIAKKIPSFFANKLISLMTGVRLHDYGCSLKAYRASLVRGIPLYGEMHRFLPAYAAIEGAKIIEIPVNHRPRQFGKSKYGLNRTFKVLLDLITVKFLGGFATKPLYAFGGLGGFCLLVGIVSFAVVAYRALILQRIQATPLIFLMVIFFLAGIQLIMMGLLAELIMRTYHESQSKKTYRIASTTNLPAVSVHP